MTTEGGENLEYPKRIAQALSDFESRLNAGELSPYKATMPRNAERWVWWKTLMRERGIRYANCSLDNYETNEGNTEAHSKVTEFCDNMPEHMRMGSGLVLLGPPGTGKDHLMMAAMRAAVIDQGYTVKWHDGLRLYQRIKAAISKGSTEDFLKGLFEPQVLCLSDPVPPRDELTAYEMSVLRDVIERRYSQMKTTWITTNVDSMATAVVLFGAAVLDRLMHGAVDVFCGGESYRMKEPAKG